VVQENDERRETERENPGAIIAPEIIRIGLVLALLLILPAVLLLFLLPAGSPEFTISLFTLALGGLVLAFVGLLYWLATRL
jgi:hypothetical protein